MAFPPRDAYERFIYSLPATHPEIQSSTLHLYTNSPTTCFVRGSIWFESGLELRVFEYLDFSDGKLLNYHYTVFRGQERIRWYDPQPHAEIPELRSTFPHHRHEPPEIKHNRKPAPGISLQVPNLPTLIADCIALGGSIVGEPSVCDQESCHEPSGNHSGTESPGRGTPPGRPFGQSLRAKPA